MKKVPSLPPSISKIWQSLALGGVLALLVFYWFYKSTPGDIPVSTARLTREVVLSALPQLLERWQSGDIENNFATAKWTCPELPASPYVGPGFMACEPRYFECWARGLTGNEAVIKIQMGGKEYRVKPKASFAEEVWLGKGPRHGQFVTRFDIGSPELPNAGLLVDIEVEGEGHWPLLLEDTCHDVYLPQRFYSYGARADKQNKTLEMEWDNDKRKIFVDKFLVSNADYFLWKKKPPNDLKTLALPVTGLSTAEQEEYCAWMGGRRMEAHLFDAASMQVLDVSRPFPSFVVKSWLPWTRDRHDSFFEMAASPDWKPTSEDCSRAYVKECAGVFPYVPHSTDNISWNGMAHVMGGVSEDFRNPIEPERTQRASSQTLGASDPGHQLGRRIPSSGSSGFRCYREIFP